MGRGCGITTWEEKSLGEPARGSGVKTAMWAGGILVPLLGLLLLVGLPVGGYYAYRTYDYVQHDNDFCISCHLMEEPYEAFARSEHRGLGCKACHRPTLVGRSQMALTQVVEQPEALTTHAEVPDAVCTECHVEGDPDKWRSIAASAGHRVHAESSDPALAEARCVTCHATSIHEFSSADDTCGQSECHANTDIQLGAMGDFTIHCVACHSFRSPTQDQDLEVVRAALRPSNDECLSCHVMRALVEMPEDEPHGGVCSTCHDPHQQTEASQAVETCAAAGCHDEALDLTPFHQGLGDAVYGDCSQCHTAHQFLVRGGECVACHADVGGLDPSVISVASTGSSAPHAGDVGQLAEDTLFFRHQSHLEIECVACHSVADSHGIATTRTVADCRSCHHTQESGRATCSTCHTDDDPFHVAALEQSMTFALSVGEVRVGPAGFSHTLHASTTCETCHVGAPDLAVVEDTCASCHTDHHEASVDCASCHTEAPEGAHLVEVHVGCSGAGCHTDPVVEGVPRTRPFCLTCHQDLRDHRPEENCITCHPLPDPRPSP